MTYKYVSGMFYRAMPTVTGTVIALVLIACGQSPNLSATSRSASASPSIRSSDSKTTSSQINALTGFGATVRSWNGHHAEDAKFDPGSAYDPDPALPSVLGSDAYIEVMPQDGLVTDYTINTQGLSINAAIARVRQEIPSDSRELWGARRDGCYQVELASPTLGRALAAPDVGDPQGQVFVEFLTILPDGSSVYKSTDVNQIMMSLGSYQTAASAGGC